MWQEEYVIETNIKKEKIWNLWEDVDNWNKWNADISYSNINGKFENGTNGSYKTFDGLEPVFFFFELQKCVTNKSFICRIKLALCIMDFGYEIIEAEKTIKIKHYIKICGPLMFYYRKKFGNNSAKRLQLSVNNLIKLAEK